MFNVFKRFSDSLVPVFMSESRRECITYCENQEPEREDISWAETYKIEEFPKADNWRYSKEPKPRNRKKKTDANTTS